MSAFPKLTGRQLEIKDLPWKTLFYSDSGHWRQGRTKTDTHNLVRQIGFVIPAEGALFSFFISQRARRLPLQWIVTSPNSFGIAVQLIKEVWQWPPERCYWPILHTHWVRERTAALFVPLFIGPAHDCNACPGTCRSAVIDYHDC